MQKMFEDINIENELDWFINKLQDRVIKLENSNDEDEKNDAINSLLNYSTIILDS